mmetsp:Transcript_8711/g.19044  ORF Transcript_8711/g.19044 Transcript_8711/m.19044 type:complete len:88 (-) Transcript_8711:410-673(-)
MAALLSEPATVAAMDMMAQQAGSGGRETRLLTTEDMGELLDWLSRAWIRRAENERSAEEAYRKLARLQEDLPNIAAMLEMDVDSCYQ